MESIPWPPLSIEFQFLEAKKNSEIIYGIIDKRGQRENSSKNLKKIVTLDRAEINGRD